MALSSPPQKAPRGSFVPGPCISHGWTPRCQQDVSQDTGSYLLAKAEEWCGSVLQDLSCLPSEAIWINLSPLKSVPGCCSYFNNCVGPLPKMKSGNKFLLTLMCTSADSAHFPEVIRTIKAPKIVGALVKLFTLVGQFSQTKVRTLCMALCNKWCVSWVLDHLHTTLSPKEH